MEESCWLCGKFPTGTSWVDYLCAVWECVELYLHSIRMLLWYRMEFSRWSGTWELGSYKTAAGILIFVSWWVVFDILKCHSAFILFRMKLLEALSPRCCDSSGGQEIVWCCVWRCVLAKFADCMLTVCVKSIGMRLALYTWLVLSLVSAAQAVWRRPINCLSYLELAESWFSFVVLGFNVIYHFASKS